MKKKTEAADAAPAERGATPASNGGPESRSAPKVVMLPVSGLEVHPAAKLVPRMRDDEWEPFLAHVLRNGVQTPVDAVKKGDRCLVLDGRHRLEGAKARGDKVLPVVLLDLDEAGQVEHILRTALLRRHLSDDQRAVMAAKLQENQVGEAKRERARKGGRAGGRGRTKRASDSSAHPGDAKQTAAAAKGKRARRSEETAAKAFNVSRKKVRKAKRLAKASPDLADRVLAGEVSLQEAAREAGTQASSGPPTPATTPTQAESSAAPPGQADALVIPLTADLKSFAEPIMKAFGYEQGGDLGRALYRLYIFHDEDE